MSSKEQISGQAMGAGGPGGCNIRVQGQFQPSASKRYNPFRKFPCEGQWDRTGAATPPYLTCFENTFSPKIVVDKHWQLAGIFLKKSSSSRLVDLHSTNAEGTIYSIFNRLHQFLETTQVGITPIISIICAVPPHCGAEPTVSKISYNNFRIPPGVVVIN